MANFNEILAHHGISNNEEFDTYLDRFNPLEISLLMHENVSTATLLTARDAWAQLHTGLEKIWHEGLGNLIVSLPDNWVGQAADSALEKLNAYQQWMAETIEAISSLVSRIEEAVYAFNETRRRIVAPDVIRMYMLLLETDAFNIKHEEWRIINNQAMQKYYSKIKNIMLRLSAIPEVPEELNLPIIRIKRAS